MNNSLFKHGQTLSVFVDLEAVERALQLGTRGEQLLQLLELVAEGRSLHRALAYIGKKGTSARNGGRAKAARDAGFHVLETEGAHISVALAVDLITATADATVVTIVTGDSSLVPAIIAARNRGARVEVVACPGPGSNILMETADSAVEIGNLPLGTQRRRSSGPTKSRAVAQRKDRAVPKPPVTGRRGSYKSGGSASRRRRQDPDPQEWPTPPPPSPEEMGIDPAKQVRRQPRKASPRPASQSPKSEPRMTEDGTSSPPNDSRSDTTKPAEPFTILEGEQLSSPPNNKDADTQGSNPR